MLPFRIRGKANQFVAMSIPEVASFGEEEGAMEAIDRRRGTG